MLLLRPPGRASSQGVQEERDHVFLFIRNLQYFILLIVICNAYTFVIIKVFLQMAFPINYVCYLKP